MLFGDPGTFAVEAMLEHGPGFSPVMGTNIVGRVRVHVSGSALGNYSEPSCVLASISRHLTALTSSALSLWHPALASLLPAEQFSLLDASLFAGSSSALPPEMSRCVFLTNQSEAFDGIKAFALSPPGKSFIQLLVQAHPAGPVSSAEVQRSVFSSSAAKLAVWVHESENALLPRNA